MTSKNKKPTEMPKLSFVVDKVTGEIIGYGFNEPAEKQNTEIIKVNGELAKKLELFDDQRRKKIKWDRETQAIVEIPESSRVKEQAFELDKNAWGKKSLEEKIDLLAVKLGVIDIL